MPAISDDELERLLGQYLEPETSPNPRVVQVEVLWIEDDLDCGVLHMWKKHRVRKHEVEEVLLEVPPEVEVKRHPDHANRTAFWGQTRARRSLFVVCEDWEEDGRRFLRPITAFEPEDGRDYWVRL